jgi:hypothetical protein
MAGKDRILMSTKERRRLHLIQQALEKKIKQVEVARVLGLSDRQVRRIVKRVGVEGDEGLVHRSRGQCSNRAIDVKKKVRILKLYQKRYSDFGPTLASEKLLERNALGVSDETLRLWLLNAGVTHFKRCARPHRQWRKRRENTGAMVQMDGSHHDWFEGRGGPCVLMGYIDDATGRVFGRFYEYEGTIPAMDGFLGYVEQYGIPMSVYLDRHSTYKSTAKPTVEEQLRDQRPISQFERAMGELGVEVIHAHSPQAKGRIERLFNTFQDRVVKEMRLSGIKTLEEANRFLVEYLPIYNERFSLEADQPVDFHRAAPKSRELRDKLCIKSERVLRNDFTISYEGKLYQIESMTRGKKVVVQEQLDGAMRILYQGEPLRYREIETRCVQVTSLTPPLRRSRVHTPSLDHPWRQAWRFKNKEELVKQANE